MTGHGGRGRKKGRRVWIRIGLSDVIEGSVCCVKIGDLGWVYLSMREWRSPMGWLDWEGDWDEMV